MKIGVVVHGAEAIDSGFALKTIKKLKSLGETIVCLGGTMGRTAVTDHSLEHIIDTSKRERPARAIQQMLDENYDLVCLINRGKTLNSGIRFAEMVLDKIDTHNKPLLLIEGCGAIGCTGDPGIAGRLSCELNLPIHAFKPKNALQHEGRQTTRDVGAVLIGELVQVNGIIIGKATRTRVTITTENNNITSIKGCDVKHHGLEKLKTINLETAIIRSGTPRRAHTSPRQIHIEKKNNLAVLIDHDAESALEKAKNTSIAITIGDDTTAITADLLYRYNTPIIGVTDGDKDCLLEHTHITKDSIIIQVMPGHDDIMGARIKEKMFKGADYLECPGIGELKEQVIELLKDKTVKLHVDF